MEFESNASTVSLPCLSSLNAATVTQRDHTLSLIAGSACRQNFSDGQAGQPSIHRDAKRSATEIGAIEPRNRRASTAGCPSPRRTPSAPARILISTAAIAGFVRQGAPSGGRIDRTPSSGELAQIRCH